MRQNSREARLIADFSTQNLPCFFCAYLLSYISKLFDCHPKPIRRGIAELQDEQVLNEQRIRQPGGGRKRVVETMDGLSEAFLRIIEHNTAGSPVDASIKWTHLSR